MSDPVISVQLSDGSPESALRVRTLWWYYIHLSASDREELLHRYMPLTHPFQNEGQWPKDNLFVIMELNRAVQDRVSISTCPLFSNPLSQDEYHAGYKLVFDTFDSWANTYGYKEKDNSSFLMLRNHLLECMPLPDVYTKVLTNNLEAIASHMGVQGISPDKGQQQHMKVAEVDPVFTVKLSDGSPESALRVRTLWWYYLGLNWSERDEIRNLYSPLCTPFHDEGQWPKDNLLVLEEFDIAVYNQAPMSTIPPFCNPLSHEEYAAGYDLVFKTFSEWADQYGATKTNSPTYTAMYKSLKRHLPIRWEYSSVLEARLYYYKANEAKKSARKTHANGMEIPSDKSQQQSKQQSQQQSQQQSKPSLLDRWKNIFKH